MQTVLLSLLTSVDSVGQQLLSRVQLAQKTNLSSTTITNLVAELIEQGIVAEDKNAREDEHRSVGRPRTGLYLIPDARYVVGVHIGVGLYRVAVMNLRAEIVCSKLVTFVITTPSADILRGMSLDINELLTSCGVDRGLILGVGVGASGLVDYLKGINILAPNLDWHNVPIRDYLESQLGLPVVVENNVRTMAIGETYFGAGRGVDSLAFVYGRTGVGAGLIFKGHVFRGSTKGAGEIGHTVMLLRDGELCRCGNHGCLETLISEEAILRQADQIAQLYPQGILTQTISEENDISPIERVFRAGRAGDKTVRAMLEDRAYYLGVALTGVVNLFNPELILLGGIFSRGQDFFLEPVIRTVSEMSFGGMGKRVRIESTSFGWKAGVMGASALALMHFFYQPE